MDLAKDIEHYLRIKFAWSVAKHNNLFSLSKCVRGIVC